jgi:hypothetical protein
MSNKKENKFIEFLKNLIEGKLKKGFRITIFKKKW